jgi:glycosyltransferase involved in cell wall biosynthesis
MVMKAASAIATRKGVPAQSAVVEPAIISDAINQATQSLVSVVIPTFMRPKDLYAAIQSVSRQTYSQLEAIIVNDCPDDREAVEATVNKLRDCRFTVVHHQDNAGSAAARNTGIRSSTGEILAFLDDDDIWMPTKLAHHVQMHAQETTADVVYSGYIRRWERSVWPDDIRFASPPPADVREAMRENRFCVATMSQVTVRRAAMSGVHGLDDALREFEDWDLYYRLAREWSFREIRTPLMIFRQHTGPRLTATSTARTAGTLQLLEKWKGEVNPDAFLRYYPPLASISYVQSLAFSGHRGQAWRELLSIRARMAASLFLREIPKTVALLVLGPSASGTILMAYRYCGRRASAWLNRRRASRLHK